jgi:hypothetical protein
MNRFSDEIRVIPWHSWLVSIVAAGGLAIFLTRVFPGDEGPGWPGLAFLLVMPVIFFTWFLLIGYVYGDAKRRGMRYVMWTLLAIFVPNAIGVVLYFIMREPAKVPCPKCGSAVPGGSTFCPACGAPLAAICPQCGRAVEPGWAHCTKCGNRLKAA